VKNGFAGRGIILSREVAKLERMKWLVFEVDKIHKHVKTGSRVVRGLRAIIERHVWNLLLETWLG